MVDHCVRRKTHFAAARLDPDKQLRVFTRYWIPPNHPEILAETPEASRHATAKAHVDAEIVRDSLPRGFAAGCWIVDCQPRVESRGEPLRGRLAPQRQYHA